MESQAEVFHELAEVMNELAQGKEDPAAASKISDLVNNLMELKEEGLTFQKPEKPEAFEALQNHQAYGEAVSAYFEAQKKLSESGKLNAEILAALQGFHQAPKPQTGEGGQ